MCVFLFVLCCYFRICARIYVYVRTLRCVYVVGRPCACHVRIHHHETHDVTQVN